MRGALCLVLLLGSTAMAGCSGGDVPAEPLESLELAQETVVEEAVTFHVTSPLWICSVACGGRNGPAAIPFSDHEYVAFQLTVQPSAAPGQGIPLSDVRIVVECTGNVGACAAGPLAETDGPWPATLAASGFRVADGEALVFKVEYRGPLPAPGNGAGGSYDIAGTLRFVQDVNATAEDDAISP